MFYVSRFVQKTIKNRLINLENADFVLLKNIKTWLLKSEVSVLTLINSDPANAYCPLSVLIH